MTDRLISVLDMLDVVRDLPGPAGMFVYDESASFQFDAGESTVATLVTWMIRFNGAVLKAEDITHNGRNERLVNVTFTWRGLRIDAYAYSPLPEEATTHTGKPHVPGTRTTCAACMAKCFCGPDGYVSDGSPCVRCIGDPSDYCDEPPF
jgi:hypothetical protein